MTDEGSNTARNSVRGRPFQKGDARIKRKGRPKSFDALRRLVQTKLAEQAFDGNGRALAVNGQDVTNIEAIVYTLIHSKNPADRKFVIELGFGKVPDETRITGANGEPIKHEVTLTDGSILRKLLPELATDGTQDAPKSAE